MLCRGTGFRKQYQTLVTNLFAFENMTESFELLKDKNMVNHCLQAVTLLTYGAGDGAAVLCILTVMALVKLN